MDLCSRKFEIFSRLDPFPEIHSGLLNSSDIEDYVNTIGMLDPFDTNKLKPASYQISVGKARLFWDEKENRTYSENSSDAIPINRNSITFVTVDCYFRLPNYIALRFNLCIRHVHRGLLLGTGPLIDPGFIGKLMIPIHNITNNDYSLVPGEDLIAVEFTKLTPHSSWSSPEKYKNVRISQKKNRKFVENKKTKNDLDFLQFINGACSSGKVLSSFTGHKIYVDRELNFVKQKVKRFEGFAILGILAVLVGVGALVIQSYSIVNDTKKYIADTTETLQSEINIKNERIIALENKLHEFELLHDYYISKLSSVENEVAELRIRLPEKTIDKK